MSIRSTRAGTMIVAESHATAAARDQSLQTR